MRINDTNGLLKIADNLLEELDQNAAGPELEGGAELKNEATEEREEKKEPPLIKTMAMFILLKSMSRRKMLVKL